MGTVMATGALKQAVEVSQSKQHTTDEPAIGWTVLRDVVHAAEAFKAEGTAARAPSAVDSTDTQESSEAAEAAVERQGDSTWVQSVGEVDAPTARLKEKGE